MQKPADLVEAFERVNAIKGEDHWRPDAKDMEFLTERLREALGDGFDPATVEETILGLGWVARMLFTYRLDFDQLLETADRLTEATTVGLVRSKAGFTVEQGVQAGVGAGYFTGLYMGLMLGGGDGTT